jgi:hypothetical protein
MVISMSTPRWVRKDRDYRVIEFKPRWVPEHMLAELSNLWHLSRVPKHGRYDRLLWTSSEFAKAHPELTSTAVYKDLDAMLEFGGR